MSHNSSNPDPVPSSSKTAPAAETPTRPQETAMNTLSRLQVPELSTTPTKKSPNKSFKSAITTSEHGTGDTFDDSIHPSENIPSSPPPRPTTHKASNPLFRLEKPQAVEEKDFSAAALNQHYFLVDSDMRLIEPTNAPAISEVPYFKRKWGKKALEVKKIRRLAKAVYQVELARIPMKVGYGEVSRERGTAMHIGRGYFLTSAHGLIWPAEAPDTSPDAIRGTWDTANPNDFTYEIILVSGSGNLTLPQKHVTHGLKAKIIAFPQQLTAHLPEEERSTLLKGISYIPLCYDVALLKAEDDWLGRLRNRKRPHILPAKYERKDEFPIMFLGVNGGGMTQADKLMYLRPQNADGERINSPEVLAACRQHIRPNEISYAYGHGSAFNRDEEQYKQLPTGGVGSGNMIRFDLGCIQGASGSPLVRMPWGRMVALNVGSEDEDDDDGLPVISEHCRSQAVTFEGEPMRQFITDFVIPALKGSPSIQRVWKSVVKVDGDKK